MTKQQAIARLRSLLSETWSAHSDPTDGEYNECDRVKCTWCEDTRKAIETLESADEPTGDAVLVREILGRLSTDQKIVEEQLAEDVRLYGSSWCWLIAGHKIRIPPQEMHFRNALNRRAEHE